MNIHVTELIAGQAKTLMVMFAAGILIESFMQIKQLVQSRCGGTLRLFAAEAAFWAASAVSLSSFLYYCAYGRISVHALVGFLAGVLLWKKICCGIIGTWVKTDEARNSKTTARSLTWRKPDVSDWKRDARRKRRERLRPRTKRGRAREERWRSEGVETDDD